MANSEDQISNPGYEKMHRFFQFVPARIVLYFVALNGITVTFMLRMSINLTLLAMVKTKKPINETLNGNGTMCFDTKRTDVVVIDYGGTLDWSLDNQFSILSSFYWTYILSQVIGGYSAKRFGTKKVFGYSLLVSSLCNLCIPISSNVHYTIVVILQTINGLVQGLMWPSIYAIVSAWIPIQEKSRFITCFQGAILGTMLGNLTSGFVISKLGWIYVFYIIGILGFLSSILWYLLVYDKPEQHPFISEEELRYIQTNREQCLHSQKTIPWLSILRSLPVWGIAISSFGRIWIFCTLNIYGPIYLKTVMGFTVENNGLLIGITSFLSFLSTLLFSYVSDKIVAYKLMPLEYNRKMLAAAGHIVPTIMCILMGYMECNVSAILTSWTLIEVFIASTFSAVMTNIVDISPNNSGPVSSIIQVVLLLPTIFVPLVIKPILSNENSLEAWSKIFYINSSVIFVTFIFYGFCGSGKVQPWDLSKSSSDFQDGKASIELLKNNND